MRARKVPTIEECIDRLHLNPSNESYLKELSLLILKNHPLDYLRKLAKDLGHDKLPVSQTQKLYWQVRGYSSEEANAKVFETQSTRGSFEHKRRKMLANGVSPEEAEKRVREMAAKTSKATSDAHKRHALKDPLYLKAMTHQCKEFWMKKGFTEEESIKRAAEVCEKNRKKFREKLDSGEIEKGWNNTTIEYYLKQGNTLDEAKILVSERQRTFTLEKCISKYGVEIGYAKWKARQEKWFKNYRKKSYSFVSQDLFWEIQEIFKFSTDEIAFATFDKGARTETMNLNKEARLYLDNRVVLPDFIHFPSKRIIEFDGVYYHRSTSENKARERIRDEDLRRNGYEVMHVNEKEWKDLRDEVLERCKQFLS